MGYRMASVLMAIVVSGQDPASVHLDLGPDEKNPGFDEDDTCYGTADCSLSLRQMRGRSLAHLTPSQAGMDCFENGIAHRASWLSGNEDLDSKKAATASACQQACQAVYNCVGFEWWSGSRDCYLKARTKTASRQEGVISGPRKCPVDGADLDEFWDSNGKPRPAAQAKIICPILAGLWKKGQLETTRQGVATRSQLSDAFRNVGMSWLALKVLFLKLESQIGKNELNIFEMEGDERIEHQYSTGIRDPSAGPPSEMRFDDFVHRFAARNGNHSVFHQQEMKEADAYYYHLAMQSEGKGHVRTTTFNFNEKGQNLMPAVFGFLLEAFGRLDDDGRFLTSGELHRIFFDAEWPVAWEKREWSAITWLMSTLRIHAVV